MNMIKIIFFLFNFNVLKIKILFSQIFKKIFKSLHEFICIIAIFLNINQQNIS